MKLEHITLDQLKASPLNVRRKGGKDVGDLTSSIRSLGLLQPLLVRKNCDGFDIIAGQRRYNALSVLAGQGASEPVPCIVMEEGDDAKAIEASLAENIARLPMEEIDQYKAFAALRGNDLSVEDIAARFGVTERLVEQRLAIANIITPILNAYRREEIDAGTLRVLTMATARQQTAWWKLFKSEDEHAPTGRSLKAWLFGGAQIPVTNALFDVSTYDGPIVSDLFGEDRYFADSDKFWTQQYVAIAQLRQRYLDAGWSEVVMLDVGDRFSEWHHEKTPKRKGGKVFIAVTRDGEVTSHEGWLSQKDAQRKAKANGMEQDTAPEPVKAERSELTKAMLNYLDLHRHAAVRTELLAHSGLALRLAVAHIIAGSSLWKVEADPQRADSEAIAQSLSLGNAQSGFAAERAYVEKLLRLNDDVEDGEALTTIVRTRFGGRDHPDLTDILQRLLALDDKNVLRILTFVMAETLAAQSPLIDMLGAQIGTDMKLWWTPDETFFDLLRDKEAINAVLREVAGDNTADAHLSSTSKVQKKIVADCLKGECRPKVEGWLPRYMAYPASGYTPRFAEAKPSSDTFLDEEDVE